MQQGESVTRADDIKTQLVKLVREGAAIRTREIVAKATPEERAEAANQLSKPRKGDGDGEPRKKLTVEDEEKIEIALKEALGPSNFKKDYQAWYSKSLRVIQQVLPDRLAEFKAFYQADRRKDISLSTYVISDYIAGISILDFNSRPTFNIHNVAMGHFETQIEILNSALGLLDEYLSDMTTVIQSQLLDNELGAAKSLLRAAHLRSAGVISGVVLEAHLQSVAAAHSLSVRKNPTLSTLNDILKNGGVIDVPTWRKLQYLGDIRNKCAHKGADDPSKDEVTDLIDQVEKIVHTIY
jgi:hypothetical protein